ncbi:hypothetical protein CHLNCDRAFT_19775, partial [Chlorella variabilis]
MLRCHAPARHHHRAHRQPHAANAALQGGEDDIDAVLAKFKLDDERHTRVEVKENCPAPSPRDNLVLLYGGEWYTTDRMHVYSDLFVLNVEKLSWKQVVSPSGPLPRTSHQAVCTRTALWVWGGEFTSLNQEKFRHYRDLWRLNLADWTWEQIPSKGGPSPRSGHRMALHGKRILLFGGFFDNGKETKYYNDAWSFCTEELKWTSLGPKPGHTAPAPRGGCQLALNGDQLFIFGGYSVKKTEEDKGARAAWWAAFWCLDLKSLEFERVKKQGMVPNPRTAFGMVTHRKRAVLFGGILDQEGKGDRLYSTLYNDMYAFNLENRRW